MIWPADEKMPTHAPVQSNQINFFSGRQDLTCALEHQTLEFPSELLFIIAYTTP